MNSVSFGMVEQLGREASLYTIKSKKLELLCTNYGATVVSIFVDDKDGNSLDVVLGYDNAQAYADNWSYFGATVGRNANRIAGAKVVLDGVTYEIENNDRGNNLHSGKNGLSKVIWDVKEQKEDAITFIYNSPAFDEGFPGNATIEVTYAVNDEGEFVITYHGVADATSVFNLTNHCYFNLSGHKSGDVLATELQIKASRFTPCADEKSIPTGELAPVAGTPFDFTVMKTIGRDIKADHPQIGFAGGYDHNFVIDKESEGVELVATAVDHESGIKMEVSTDTPGIQLYTANGMKEPGKNEAHYNPFGAFCLETQYFPNAINEPNFASPVYKAGEAYDSKSVYKFSLVD